MTDLRVAWDCGWRDADRDTELMSGQSGRRRRVRLERNGTPTLRRLRRLRPRPVTALAYHEGYAARMRVEERVTDEERSAIHPPEPELVEALEEQRLTLWREREEERVERARQGLRRRRLGRAGVEARAAARAVAVDEDEARRARIRDENTAAITQLAAARLAVTSSAQPVVAQPVVAQPGGWVPVAPLGSTTVTSYRWEGTPGTTSWQPAIFTGQARGAEIDGAVRDEMTGPEEE